ncbi:MAG: hypothetical protein IKP42_11300 [Ruminococcus sp.]|nr:hypothetical protein [Ruminococcus sp.]
MNKNGDELYTLELNISFLELYKSIDQNIKDAYSSENGISKYIDLMYENRNAARNNSWNNDLRWLKRVRDIRNQLVHDVAVSFYSDICSQEDYEWLEGFYNRLMTASDLLSLERKQRERNYRQPRNLYAPPPQVQQPVIYQNEQIRQYSAPQNDTVPHNSAPQENGSSFGCAAALVSALILLLVFLTIFVIVIFGFGYLSSN